VIEMWASFGWFVYNRDFFAEGEGTRELRAGIVERSAVAAGRRRCELDYGDGHVDVFEWQLYTDGELGQLAARHGLTPVERAAAPERPSMQLVLQRD
jgi:hypothetical protein